MISIAHAADTITSAAGNATNAISGAVGDVAIDTAVEAPDAMSAFLGNMIVILILVFLFYVLLVMPQQKRFRMHKEMLDSLSKGDRVVTAGGLIGKVHKILDNDEIIIDLGNNIRVTAQRSTINEKLKDKEKKAASSSSKPEKDSRKKNKK